MPFEGCGHVYVTDGEEGGDGCYTFVTHNGRYLLDDIGDFEPGDAVCVFGELEDEPCGDTGCGQISGCIVNATLFPAFEGTGAMVAGPGDCGAFESLDGARYQLTGFTPVGFSEGDEVTVLGLLGGDCFSSCNAPCIELPHVAPAAVRVGTLLIGPGECPRVLDDSGAELVVENVLGFNPGDRVYVAGIEKEQSPLCGTGDMPVLEHNAITELYEVCADVVTSADGCLGLTTADGDVFLIDDAGGLVAGNVVRIAGIARDHVGSPCTSVAPTMKILSFAPCVAGDVTLDGNVDIDDLIAIIVAWGTADVDADLTKDGIVNVDDLMTSLLNWG